MIFWVLLCVIAASLQDGNLRLWIWMLRIVIIMQKPCESLLDSGNTHEETERFTHPGMLRCVWDELSYFHTLDTLLWDKSKVAFCPTLNVIAKCLYFREQLELLVEWMVMSRTNGVILCSVIQSIFVVLHISFLPQKHICILPEILICTVIF